MPLSFLPTWKTPEVTKIRASFLQKQGIQLLMLDFDNTLVPYTTDTPTPEVVQWLADMQAAGLTVCVVSNSKRGRVPAFCKKYGIDCITHAKKPFSKGIRECLNRYQIPASQAVLVGDQIYTDTLGGNGAGVGTILVKAIHNHTIWLKLRHIAELPFIFFAGDRRMYDEKS